MNNFTFFKLREANLTRLPIMKNKHGNIIHSKSDGSDWSLSRWSNALFGEVGELADEIKKVEREDFTLEENRQALASELADIQIYLDLLAARCGVDLAQATIDKFNEVSSRVKVPVYIQLNDEGNWNVISGKSCDF